MSDTTFVAFLDPSLSLLNKLLRDIKLNPYLRDQFFILNDKNGSSLKKELQIIDFMLLHFGDYYFNGYLTINIIECGVNKSFTILMFHKSNTKGYLVSHADSRKESSRFVVDEVFTREIYNNIWHFSEINETKNIKTVINRIALLTIWDNENYAFYNKSLSPIILKRKYSNKIIPGEIPFVFLSKNISISVVAE